MLLLKLHDSINTENHIMFETQKKRPVKQFSQKNELACKLAVWIRISSVSESFIVSLNQGTVVQKV